MQERPQQTREPVQRSVLIVDDDETFRERLARALTSRGWRASTAANAQEALEQATPGELDLALLDLKLRGEDGLRIVRELREADDSVCIIMLTGYGSIATALTATRLGADHYLSKPADADQILQAYERASGEDSAVEQADVKAPSLARVEWEHIQRVLADCDGNISKAAKTLGLHRRSLQRKLGSYPPPT